MKNEVFDWCKNAKSGCTECKKRMGMGLIKKLGPFNKRRAELSRDKSKIINILKQGKEKASSVASKMLKEVKEVMGIAI